MRAFHLVLLTAFLPLLCLPNLSHGVSYFGDSFCRIMSIQDVSSFHLSLQFKTSRRSGLLVLAAGVRNYLFLELQNGELQVRMDLGSGEMVLSSSQGLKLNNLSEHKVSITMKEAKLTMLIDELFSTFIPVSGTQEDLNIDLGVYLGGTGDLEASYLSIAIPPFRGCMTNVKLESHQFDILASEPIDCHDTKESCSGEFEVGDGEATSFISPDSFVSFPTWSGVSGSARTLEFLMKTTIEDALLTFHPGLESDFIAVGIAGGHLKGVVDLGNGMVVLDNVKVQLDDDQWHRIKISVEASVFEINVDSQSTSLPLSGSERLDLVGNLYLGGIQGKMKEVFRDSSLSRMEEEITSETFIGCLGEIKVNQKEKSLQDALVTKDVHVKCEGEDYDYSSYYDNETPTTVSPVRIRYVTVNPNEKHCYPTKDTPEAFQNITKLLEVNTLFVPEGGEGILDINNLKPTFDLNSVGIRQSQIIFTLQSDPWYGLLDMNINSKRTKKFTLLDVVNKKIKYLHDGNEKYADQIHIEVAAHSNSYLPECLKNPRLYVIPVEIIPVNDIPQLSGGDISITENGRTRLNAKLIKIVDSDSRCDDLSVTVISEPPREVGYLENSLQPGKIVKKFKCRHLKDGNIYFVHKSGSGGLTLQVSDGQSISHSTNFKLSVTQPQMMLVTNTGLLLSQGSNSSIGTQNLVVNATPRNGDIVYNITNTLRYGEFQILTSSGSYKQVTSFHQSDLEQDRLRYISTDSSDLEDIVVDHIQFDVHLGQLSLWNNTFLIKITPSQFKMTQIVPLEITNAGEQMAIKHTELKAEVKGKNLEPKFIRYILLKAPKLGTLQMLGNALVEGDSFTQEDLWNSQVSYKVRERRAVASEDKFVFKVFAENQYSPVYTYPIKIQADSDAPVLTNEAMVVLESGESILNKDYLWVQTSSSSDFVYRVTQDPRYGRLIRESPPGQPRFEGAVKVFSKEDLELNRLIYQHDGSESSNDEFSFLAFEQAVGSDYIRTDGQESISGVFRISIKSKNDHVPLRVIDKTFNVVRNGQRLLTTEDILFRDDDSGFNDTQLVFVRTGILSGNIVSTSDPSQPIFRFTQADLRDQNVLFIHHGADRERFQLQVSDGLHKTTALLQIQAGEAYLHVVNNTMVVMDHGSTKTLNTSFLSAESNMDIRDTSEIKYEVTSPPSDGKIIVSGIESSRFTQEDLRKGVVSYEHNDNSMKSKDSFGFTVGAKGISDEGTFRIKIFKQGYLSEPEVINNEVIISYEGEHIVINQDHLKVLQDDILPTEMVFTIKESPLLGHIVKLTNQSDSTAAPVLNYIHSFTQEDINKGRILYVSASIQGMDSFAVDVSNGFTTVEDLQISVDIVPRLIPIQALNFSVREGGEMALTMELLNISHPFYRNTNVEFIVEEPPQYGNIRYLDRDYDDLSFTWEDVILGQIYYLHDGRESVEDNFTLSASAYEIQRRSLPVTFAVTVIPVNDEPPKLRHNTGLEVLAGEESDITTTMLNTEDEDTPNEELVYSIESPINGMVALKVEPDVEIENFTQAQVNNGEVIFIHEGLESGGFSFTVTDGEHTSPLYNFVVTARQLTISTEDTGKELVVFPGTRHAITSANLKAVTNEDGDEISFSLVRPPRLGRLILAKNKNQFEEITRFSQSELDSGAVFYEHQLPEEPFWVVRDSVELLLSSPPAPVVHHVLPITVSYNTDHHNASSQLWKNKGLDIVQGQRKVIDSSILDGSNLLASLPESERGQVDVIFELSHFPSHGRVTLRGLDLPQDAPYFKQEDVAQGNLEYLHNDSGASMDSFSFRVWLSQQGSGVASPTPAQRVVLEEIFNISIRRRDSSPPELVSLDVLLEVLQGSTTVITQKYLNTRDEDSTPDEVRFTISKAPANGRLVDATTGDPISMFSQEAVNQGQVGFVSDGSLSDGYMEFIVSDGKHRTPPHTLHIGILSRRLVLVKAPEIQVLQGDDETLLTEKMLRATTGGPNEEDILYKITSVPKYAAVMVDRQPTSAFTQTQIREGRVSVRFIKSTSPRDSVAFVARSRAANASSVLNITVKPLVNIPKEPLLPRGAVVLLDRKLLDATPLANKTRTLPTFSVIQQPRGARFIRAGGRGPEVDGKPIDTFTQKELDEGGVAMEILNGTGSSQAKDEARFLLKAHGVPPAECVLNFKTAPYNASRVYAATILKVPAKSGMSDGNNLPEVPGFPHNTPASPHSGSSFYWPTTSSINKKSNEKIFVYRRNNLWSILIPILVVLLILLVAAILAFYLVRRNKTGKHNVQTVASSKPKNGEVSQETFRKTDPASNIPMSQMDSKDADPELLQHCRTTNPALKKNQYWV
ncbi:hypothetical protein UPYG_G00259150 [Umbra pygmaea]|uniref:Laminin G domain-containing protein n=1 Tax=Umbra pygmaea TaxID=75934 RepID=A0ABD0W8T6_UMBPY